jgi:regulator of RNase E activity RraA
MSSIRDSAWLKDAQKLSTAEISDALDYFKLPGSVFGIKSIAGPKKIFGFAFTMRFVPIDKNNPGTVGDFIDDMQAGDVAVLDNGGRLDCTVWGGILSQIAAHRKIAGTVIHGVCRDTAEADSANYPLYASGYFMRTGKDRVQIQSYGEVVSLGDVRVAQGDLIVADQDGVVVVAAANAKAVVERALKTREMEEKIIEAALAGEKLSEARKKYGYHVLQRSPEQIN